MLNDDETQPVHLDGAIRRYDDESMLRRVDQTIYEAGRNAEYTKLWRIDGTLDVATWKELITHYFRDNWLVGEYFGAPPEPESEPIVLAAPVDPHTEFVPYDLTPADGVHLQVSYFEKCEGRLAEREIVSFDCLTNGETLYFIDPMAVEIVKRLRRSSLPVEVPQDLVRVKFWDCVYNLPVFAHHGRDAVEHGVRTLDTIVTFLSDLARNFNDRLVSFTIAADYEDREVRFSWAGHLIAIVQWFERCGVVLPETTGEVSGWVERNYESLNTCFGTAHNERVLHELLQESGMLVFQRSFLDPDSYDVVRSETTGELGVVLLQEPTVTHQLSPALAFEILEYRCARCGLEYEECPHCKFEETAIGCRIVRSNVLGAFWTNRPA